MTELFRPTSVGGVSRASASLSASTSTRPSPRSTVELEVTDDFRIRSTIPLFEDLLARGATVVACTHFGRPKGQVVAEVQRRAGAPPSERAVPGVELMENLRFNPGEESDDRAFGASLVAGFDYYINEAFSASHRAHASIMIPPELLPSAAGPNLQREVSTIQSLLDAPARPFVAIVGGAKVADKLGIVRCSPKSRHRDRRRGHGLHLRG